MPPILSKILISLIWMAVGALFAWLSFLSLQKQARSIQLDGEAPLEELPKLIAGRTLRLVLVGLALYIAVRMNVLYALLFIVALTLTTWLLVNKQNRQAPKHFDD